MRFLILILAAASLFGQASPKYTITPADASTSGSLCFKGTNGQDVCISVENPVTAHNLTWPGTVTPGCLSVDGSNLLSWQSCVSLPITDSSALIKGSADATKLIRFEVDGLTTATTRVATFPDANFTLAGINISQTFTANQTLAANLLFDSSSTRDIGANLTPGSNIYFKQLYASAAAGNPQASMQALGFAGGWVYAKNLSDLVTGELDANGVRVNNGGTFRVGASTVIDSNRYLQNIAGVATNLVPTTAGTRDLGSVALPYREFHGNQAFVGSVIPPVTAGSTVGTFGIPYAQGYFQNINISGVCTGCGSIGDATQFVRGAVSTTSQSFGGDKTFFGSVLPGSARTYSLGNSTYPWYNVTAARVEIADLAFSSAFWSLTSDAGAQSTLYIKDNSGTNALILSRNNFVYGTNRAWLDMDLLPLSGTRTLGTSTNRWNGLSTNAIEMPSTGSVTAYVGSGNFYNRTFAGSPFCGGVTDGWTGVDTFNLRIWVCIGGVARYATLF